MIRRIVLGILGFLFLVPLPAKAQGIYSIHDMIYSIYINAVTGELIPTVPVV